MTLNFDFTEHERRFNERASAIEQNPMELRIWSDVLDLLVLEIGADLAYELVAQDVNLAVETIEIVVGD